MNNIDDLEGKVFLTSSACMSVWADGLSWANTHTERVSKNPEEAENIAVLSCQVTDLAILNDLRILEGYRERFPNKRYLIAGCLAKREDVELPGFMERLETPRENYQFIFDRSLVNFEKPFWIQDFKENDEEFKQGHLFREMYPLRIGKGCANSCTYCTLRITRGKFEKYDASRLEEEFLAFDNILLVADNPTSMQIKDWHALALKHNKGFSVRNVEPSTTAGCKDEIIDLADRGLLRVYHSPIQSADEAVLRDMNRNVAETFDTIKIAGELKKRGVYIATNIIIDYKNLEQDFAPVYQLYDYVSWNPLWDNRWDRRRAEERFERYLGEGAKYNPTLMKIRELEAGR